MSALFRFVTLCAFVAGALSVCGRLNAGRFKNRERERRRALFINCNSLSGTALADDVSNTCFEVAALAGIDLPPFGDDGLPTKSQRGVPLKVISVGTGSDLRVCVTVEYAAFPTWMRCSGEEPQARWIRETKGRLTRAIQQRLAGRLRSVLPRSVPDLNATLVSTRPGHVKDDDVQVILVLEGSRLVSDACHHSGQGQ